MALDDILNAFIGGGIPQKGQARAETDPLAEMLQGILGGGMGGAMPQGMGGGSSGMGGDPLGGLLEAILGGGMAQAGSSSGGMQGGMGVLPGMGGDMGMNALLAPLADALAKKLGLPPEIAMMVVSFLGAKLLSGAGGQTGSASGSQGGKSSRSRGAQAQSLDLDSLLETMGNDKGMAKELAEQTGLDQATAERSLQEAIGMIGGGQEARKPRPSNRPSGGGLDSLLDSW